MRRDAGAEGGVFQFCEEPAAAMFTPDGAYQRHGTGRTDRHWILPAFSRRRIARTASSGSGSMRRERAGTVYDVFMTSCTAAIW